MQLTGAGAHKNLDVAIEWLNQAAEQNHSKAQTRLAWCYQTGTGVEEDLETAVTWYRAAAASGNAHAQFQ